MTSAVLKGPRVDAQEARRSAQLGTRGRETALGLSREIVIDRPCRNASMASSPRVNLRVMVAGTVERYAQAGRAERGNELYSSQGRIACHSLPLSQ